MPLTINMTKQSAGEHFMIEVRQYDPQTNIMHTVDEMKELLNQAIQLADERTYEMNMRCLEAYQLRKYCQDSTWQKISQVLDIVSGKVEAARIAYIWESEIEETRALEEERARAVMNGFEVS